MQYRTLGLPYHSDIAFYRRVNVEYTLAAVTAFTESLTLSLEKPLRFIYCSGAAAVRDQEKPLWLMPQTRKIRVGLCSTSSFAVLFYFSFSHLDSMLMNNLTW